MKEIDYKDLRFNPFNLLGKEWMLLSAGNEQDGCNTMTIKTFVDKEEYFTLCVMDAAFKKQMAYLGSVSGRDEDKIGKSGLTKVFADNSVYFKEAKLVLVCKKEYAAELQASGFIDKDVLKQAYPANDLHTMYVGKIEKVLVRDDEYLNG